MKIGRHCIQVDYSLWLFFICFNLYFWNVLTLGENAEAFLSCPTSSSLPGTTGRQFQCQHACLWCMVIYFCCMFIYLIKMCVGKYAMVYLHNLFQGYFKNVTTSTAGGCGGWLYFLILFLPFGILFNICTNLLEFSSFFKVCCTAWTLAIWVCVQLNFMVLKELGNGLTDVFMLCFSFLSHALIL